MPDEKRNNNHKYTDLWSNTILHEKNKKMFLRKFNCYSK